MASLPVARDEAKHAIGELIQEHGLDNITSAKIREHLKNKFGTDFTDYKRDVDELTREKITEMNDAKKTDSSSEDSDHSDDEKAAGTKGASDSDAETNGKAASSTKVKAVRRKAASPDMSDDDLVSKVKRRRSAATPAPRKTKKTKTKSASKGVSAFSRVCYISDELQQLTGKEFMRRCDVIKIMWQYIKENNLKSPKDGRVVLCDDVLKSIFKKDKFQAFGMMGILKNHIKNPKDMSEEIQEKARMAQEELVEELNKKDLVDDKDGRAASEVVDSDE